MSENKEGSLRLLTLGEIKIAKSVLEKRFITTKFGFIMEVTYPSACKTKIPQ